MTDKTNTAKRTANQTNKIKKHCDSLPTTSAKIRYLTSEGYSRGEVARLLDIRYQHVRNVLVTPVKNPIK